MDLIGPDGKNMLEGVIDHIHDTFKRPVYAYRDEQVAILSFNPSYNAMYGSAADPSQDNKTVELAPQTFYCRIFYYNQFNRPININDSTVLGLDVDVGRARVKCDNAAYEFFKDAKRVEFDNKMFMFHSPKPVGLFGQARWEFQLEAIK